MTEFQILEVREERIGEMLGGGLLAAGGARDGPGGNVSQCCSCGAGHCCIQANPGS